MSFAIKKTASAVRTGLMLVISAVLAAQLIHMTFGLVEQWHSIVQVVVAAGINSPVVDLLTAIFKLAMLCWLATFAGLGCCLYPLVCCFAFSSAYQEDEMSGLVNARWMPCILAARHQDSAAWQRVPKDPKSPSTLSPHTTQEN